MANANAPRGLTPVRYLSGAPYAGPGNLYYIAAATNQALYIGDPVKATGTSDANGVPGITIGVAGATNYILGSFGGAVPFNGIPVLQSDPVYHPAAASQYVYVHDDPNLLFMVQEDSVGGAMSVDSSSANVDLVAGAGSTVTGFSGWMLDSSTPPGTGNTLQMRILQALQGPGNTPGEAYTKWLCKINLHALNNLTGI